MSFAPQNTSLAESLKTYDAAYFDGERELSTERIKETISLLGSVSGKSILDLGCGTGEGSSLLRSFGAKVTCADISKSSTSICKNQGLESIQSVSHLLPFPDKSFDGVLFMDVIEHIPRSLILQTLGEIKRVTKTDGKIAIHTMPTVFLEKLSQFYGLINKRHWRRFGEQGGHINTYTSWKLKRDILLAGLEISTFKIGAYPSNAPFSNIVRPCSGPFKAFLGNDLWVAARPTHSKWR